MPWYRVQNFYKTLVLMPSRHIAYERARSLKVKWWQKANIRYCFDLDYLNNKCVRVDYFVGGNTCNLYYISKALASIMDTLDWPKPELCRPKCRARYWAKDVSRIVRRRSSKHLH